MSSTNATPSWIPSMMAALMTVAATWGLIRTEVASVVQAEVSAQLATHRAAMVHQMDSLFKSAGVQVDTLLQQRIKESADRVTNEIGLLPVNRPDGTVVYQPNITVQADTVALQVIQDELDTLKIRQADTMREVWEIKDVLQIPSGKRTRWGRKQ
jgi:hypothetical protein